MMISLFQDFDNEMKQHALGSCTQYLLNNGKKLEDLDGLFHDLSVCDKSDILAHFRGQHAARNLGHASHGVVEAQEKVANAQQVHQDSEMEILGRSATPQTVRIGCRVLANENRPSLTFIIFRRQIRSKKVRSKLQKLNRWRRPVLSKR